MYSHIGQPGFTFTRPRTMFGLARRFVTEDPNPGNGANGLRRYLCSAVNHLSLSAKSRSQGQEFGYDRLYGR